MKLKAAIFDLDGTILDTLGDLFNSVNYSLKLCNLPSRTIDEVRSFVGNGIRLLIERAVPQNTPIEITDKCFEIFKSYYKNHSSVLTKPYPGIAELLKELKNNGISLAVVSNKADFAVQALVEQYFPRVFDFAVGEKENIRRKPAPDSVLCALNYLNVNKSEAIYIGDSEVDIETARNAGISCIAVLWGFRDEKFLCSLNPDYIVSKPSEIAEVIDN